MSELLFSPFLAFHLLALNLASVGPLLCIWLRRRGASDATDGAIRDRVGQRLAWMSLGGLVAGSLAGVVPMLQSGSEFYASLSRFPARTYWSAGGELLFALVCLWAYAAMWRRLADRPVWHGTLAVLGTTTLLYHFPPLMVVLAKLADNPQWVANEVIERATFVRMMFQSDVLALTTHFVLASFVVAAVATIWLLAVEHSKRQAETGEAESTSSEADPVPSDSASRAAVVAIVCTVLQLPGGIWILLTLPAESRTAVLGENMLASLCFAGGVAVSLVLLKQLVEIVVDGLSIHRARRSAWLLVVIVLLMVVTLQG